MSLEFSFNWDDVFFGSKLRLLGGDLTTDDYFSILVFQIGVEYDWLVSDQV